MMQLSLYTKPGCHLCEEALAALAVVGVTARQVDISGQTDLQARYGMHIPVLQRQDDGQELRWPFGPADIRRLLAV
jgi:hypothetical protein